MLTESPIYNSGTMVNVVTPTDTVAYMPESARAVHKQASTKGKLRGRLWPRFTLRNSLLTSHKFLEFLVVAGTLRKFNFCAEIPRLKMPDG